MRFTDLKNLKKAVDFAKKVLVNDGEALVEEKTEPFIHATAAVEEMATDAISVETETSEVEIAIPEEVPELEAEDTLLESDTEADTELEAPEETEEDPKEDAQAQAPKKRKSKKGQHIYTEESE
jgi:hypothetical protein